MNTNNGFIRDWSLLACLEVVVRINLKSKKLIILIAVLVAVIAVIVILATVFSVRNVTPVFHNFDGSMTLPADDAPTAEDVLKLCGGRSMFFMSKDKLLEELNAQFPAWHAFEVVKNFPDIIDVHFVKREVAAKIDIGGNMAYIDTYGYVMDGSVDIGLDISSAFERRDATVNSVGRKLQFVEAQNNERLGVVIEAIMAGWRCNVELGDMAEILGSENVFTFDENNNLIIHMRAGAQIKVVEPTTELTDRLIAAYSVYYNDKLNLQQSGVVITVEKNGNIITPNTNR